MHVASFTKEVNSRLAKRPLKINGRLPKRGLTSLVKEVTGLQMSYRDLSTLQGTRIIVPEIFTRGHTPCTIVNVQGDVNVWK